MKNKPASLDFLRGIIKVDLALLNLSSVSRFPKPCPFESARPIGGSRVPRRQREERSWRADYVWEQLYEAAVLETDDKNLSNRLQAAKATIDSRRHEMQVDHGGTPEELQAISNALHGLNLLQAELETRSHAAGSSNP
jgi:hypothetical protein